MQGRALRERGEIQSFAHHGFGYVPEDEAHSERRYMEEVVAQTDLRMTYVDGGPRRILDVIPAIARQQDEPFGTASIVAQWFVFEAAARAGLKVMLDGQGADEVLGGYHAYLPMVARTYLSELEAHSLRALCGLAPSDVRRPTAHSPRRGGHGLPRPAPPRGLRGRGSSPLPQPSCHPRSGAGWHLADAESLEARSINDILARATGVQLPALLRFEDRNSMAHSIEARVPFLDHRMVEFAFRLPGEDKIHGAVTKHVLREGLAGVLPEAIRTRSDKVGFRADPDDHVEIRRPSPGCPAP